MNQTCFHVTVLSNFARGYDKYSETYSKQQIPESTYPDRFFLLDHSQLGIGYHKASALLKKMALPENELLVIETVVASEQLQPNTRTGLGQFVLAPAIRVTKLHRAIREIEGYCLEEITPEDAMACSLKILHQDMQSFENLAPRTVSILPIARGCQASCPFCFSEASASAIQDQAKLDLQRIETLTQMARARGAERFVITGGGEPGLMRHANLLELIEIGQRELGKTVLITNSYHLSNLPEDQRLQRLEDYANAGLGVLAISRHHSDPDKNAALMNLKIMSENVAATWAAHEHLKSTIRLRYICVLQSGGVASLASIADYLTWATSLGVEEICFKELYVSTSTESVFHAYPANLWSRNHRVPLSLVLDFAREHDMQECGRLPWGSPIFCGRWQGKPIRIAAYTEPSLFWERTQGIARSWNIMADGKCLVSLEDRASEISPEQAVA